MKDINWKIIKRDMNTRGTRGAYKTRENLAGQTFGRWSVKSYAGKRSNKNTWLCECDCGKTGVVGTGILKSGRSASCGCLQKERVGASAATHKLSKTPLYQIWAGMIQRCENSKASQFHNYGGRGITVCGRWRSSFEAFLDDVPARPSNKHSLDRIDNNGNYEPGNVRWATMLEQSNNTRKNVRFEIRGISRTVPEWSREYSVNTRTVYALGI